MIWILFIRFSDCYCKWIHRSANPTKSTSIRWHNNQFRMCPYLFEPLQTLSKKSSMFYITWNSNDQGPKVLEDLRMDSQLMVNSTEELFGSNHVDMILQPSIYPRCNEDKIWMTSTFLAYSMNLSSSTKMTIFTWNKFIWKERFSFCFICSTYVHLLIAVDLILQSLQCPQSGLFSAALTVHLSVLFYVD